MLYKANLEPIIVDCEQPPVTTARLLRDLLTTELPKTHDQGPPIIRDTSFDEQGIYFDTPIEIEETDGMFMLRIKGSVWTWDGERYVPDNEHVDVLDVEILPSGTGGSKVRAVPAFALGGIEKHIEALLARVFGELDGAPETLRDAEQERAADDATNAETTACPRPEIDTLLVQRDLDTVAAALLNHAEDSDSLLLRLQPVDSPSSQIRKYEVITGTAWPGRDERTVLRDDRLKLGTIRLTRIQDDTTEVVIRREYWGMDDQMELYPIRRIGGAISANSLTYYLATEEHLELYRQFFDRLIDLLAERYGATGERVINPGRPSFERRIPIVDHYTKEIIYLDVARFGNETLQRFSKWLVQYLTHGIRLPQFPMENGCFYTLDCHFLDEDKMLSYLSPDGPGLEIKGQYHTRDGKLVGERWMIRFKTLQPTPKGIPIVAKCWEPAVMEFFHEVVREMKAWSPPLGGQQSMKTEVEPIIGGATRRMFRRVYGRDPRDDLELQVAAKMWIAEAEKRLDDPVMRMIYARLSQPEITNDPVLGALQDMPEAELTEAVRARLTAPIDVPPAGKPAMPAKSTALMIVEQDQREREAALVGQSDLSRVRSDARLRYQRIIDYWIANPEKTEGQVADHCRVSTRTVQRAMKHCSDWQKGK
ncbi:MAG: hypothetical protein JXA14_26595 [Anaerolineae bacterium]|nr:hypothetical protein [Anaerolineae bacterium]